MTAFFAALLALLAGFMAPAPTPPPVDAVADYQLGGAYEPASGVKVITRDSTEKPVPGLYNICYVNAFQTQPGSLGWWERKHPDLLLRSAAGALIRDADWPDEVLLDLRTGDNRKELAGIVDGWFGGCADDGYDGVEADNLDSWTRSGAMIERSHTEAFARLLVRSAHQYGLAIAQKNTVELDGSRLGFDFAVTEECEAYDECGSYIDSYGQHVIEIEYTDKDDGAFDRACAAQGKDITVMLRDRDLVRPDHPDYFSEAC